MCGPLIKRTQTSLWKCLLNQQRPIDKYNSIYIVHGAVVQLEWQLDNIFAIIGSSGGLTMNPRMHFFHSAPACIEVAIRHFNNDLEELENNFSKSCNCHAMIQWSGLNPPNINEMHNIKTWHHHVHVQWSLQQQLKDSLLSKQSKSTTSMLLSTIRNKYSYETPQKKDSLAMRDWRKIHYI